MLIKTNKEINEIQLKNTEDYLSEFYLTIKKNKNNLLEIKTMKDKEEDIKLLTDNHSFISKVNEEILFDMSKDDFFNIKNLNFKKFLIELLCNILLDNNAGYYGLTIDYQKINNTDIYVGDLVFIIHENSLFFSKGIILLREDSLFLNTNKQKFKNFRPFEKESVYMYIGINKELNMSEGKTSAQTAHVVKSYLHNIIFTPRNPRNKRDYKTIIADRKYEEALYEYYRMHGQKVITLGIKQKDMLKYESQGYIAVRDSGYTEIPPNSLTAICFGITQKKDRPKFLNRHNLL